MAVLVLVVLVLAQTGYSSANWCVCRSDVSDSALQKALDYACGAGADCTPIVQNGACYQPNTVRAHCSYAVNSYYQKKGQAQGTCEFSNSATVVTADPSPGGTCVYPSSASSTGTSTTPTTTPPSTTTPSTTPSTTTPTTTTPSTTTPSTTTPSTLTPTTTTPSTTTGGIIGGIGSGLGPSGSGINTDTSDGGLLTLQKNLLSVLTLGFSGLLFLC